MANKIDRNTYYLIETIQTKDLEETIIAWNEKGITVQKSDLIADGFVLYGNLYSGNIEHIKQKNITPAAKSISSKVSFSSRIRKIFGFS